MNAGFFRFWDGNAPGNASVTLAVVTAVIIVTGVIVVIIVTTFFQLHICSLQ
jgi:preprotein translocase subunit Sec61beta